MFPAAAALSGAVAIADSAHSFAEAVLGLYGDGVRWERQAVAGAAFAKAFCPEMLKRDILDSWCGKHESPAALAPPVMLWLRSCWRRP